MSQPNLEERIKVLEREFETFKKNLQDLHGFSRWQDTFGMFAEHPELDEVLRLGREYREEKNQKPLPGLSIEDWISGEQRK